MDLICQVMKKANCSPASSSAAVGASIAPLTGTV